MDATPHRRQLAFAVSILQPVTDLTVHYDRQEHNRLICCKHAQLAC